MEKNIIKYIKEGLETIYKAEIYDLNISVEKTREGIDGDYTVVVFPLVKYSKKKPEDTARDLGVFIKQRFDDIASYNVIKGFLNFKMTQEYWINRLKKLTLNNDRQKNGGEQKIMIEFSSPNTNKPLHLGHIRNNLLGDSVSRILKAAGNDVIKVNLINDRGIHICKSMLAWTKWGENSTPDSTNQKGDKLVGEYYVLFDKKYKEQIAELVNTGMTEDEAKEKAPLMLETREILQKWEAGDKDIRSTWAMMNSWVYDGFEQTYNKLGISFDKIYYESSTYLLGKELVSTGLEKGIFTKDPDNSVWIDLTEEGLDRKILLRSDGTTVYMTQDLGTAFERFDEFNPDKMIYVVGNEQDYHFNVLKKIVGRFDADYSSKIEHLSYGMVELPEGKMKSREGTVVDADDLIEEMILTATKISEESGKMDDLSESERERIIKMIALGALKYYIIKVDPKKQMTFNPKESIDFTGNTGPFIQYTHARICSILRKAEQMNIKFIGKISTETQLLNCEIKILSALTEFDEIINESANRLDPGIIANYIFSLAKEFNQFYHDHSILKEKNAEILQFRLQLSHQVARTIKNGMELLGIEVPEKM
ncbi:MAG: arginine--tRNA ligase [Bacteroidales bacterium]|nr:arginine--tRNA ligase [Bacteroidales bacterium]